MVREFDVQAEGARRSAGAGEREANRRLRWCVAVITMGAAATLAAQAPTSTRVMTPSGVLVITALGHASVNECLRLHPSERRLPIEAVALRSTPDAQVDI